MDASLLDVALAALSVLLEPERLFYLGMGTVIGLALGIMPGVGGVAGLALLLPFTFNLDAYSAFAFNRPRWSQYGEEWGGRQSAQRCLCRIINWWAVGGLPAWFDDTGTSPDSDEYQFP